MNYAREHTDRRDEIFSEVRCSAFARSCPPRYPLPSLPLSAILPSEPLLLMGAGPVPIPQAVAQANGVIINHLGPTMDRVIQSVKRMAGYAFQTSSTKIHRPGRARIRGDGDGGVQHVLARPARAVPEERHVQRPAGRDGRRRGGGGHLPRE